MGIRYVTCILDAFYNWLTTKNSLWHSHLSLVLLFSIPTCQHVKKVFGWRPIPRLHTPAFRHKFVVFIIRHVVRTKFGSQSLRHDTKNDDMLILASVRDIARPKLPQTNGKRVNISLATGGLASQKLRSSVRKSASQIRSRWTNWSIFYHFTATKITQFANILKQLWKIFMHKFLFTVYAITKLLHFSSHYGGEILPSLLLLQASSVHKN